MSSTAVFFDMEFSSFECPQLISLGAVTADGKQEFYAEVAPLPDGCSDFVHEHVVPLLTGPAYPKKEVARRFLDWLAGLGDEIELCSDSGYDRDLLYELCGYPLPVSSGALCTWFPLPGTVDNNPHHALQDARMLQKTFAQHFTG